MTNEESIKQCEEPESIRVCVEMECGERDRVTKRESGSERADALRRTNLATRERSTQPSDRAAYS